MIFQSPNKHVSDRDCRRTPWPHALAVVSGVGTLPASPPRLPRGCIGEPVLAHVCAAAIQGEGVGIQDRGSVLSWRLAAALLFTASLQLLRARAGALGSEPSCPSPCPSARKKLEPP